MVQRGVSETCFQRFGHKEKGGSIVGTEQVENIFYIRCMHTP